MFSCLCVCTSLLLAQTPAEPDVPPATAPAAAANRWLLMNALQGTWYGAILDSQRLQVSGWTEASFTASTDRHTNYPQGFNDRANEFLLQQHWIRFDQPVVASGSTEPSFGFRSDLLVGSDYRYTLPRGLFNGQLTANNGQPNLYGVDPVQFYADAYFPTIMRGLDIKIGRFFALYGVEQISAPDNALFSHSLDDLFDPFTHTGVLGTLKLTDTWTIQAGLVTGSDIFVGPGSNPTFTGSVKWAPPDGRDSVLFCIILGRGRFDQEHNLNNPQYFDLVYTHKFNPRLNYNFEASFGFTNNVPDIGTAYWGAMLHYLTYDFTPRTSGTVRLGLFDDPQGQRTGFPGLYTQLTTGLNIRPRRDVMIRPELRWNNNNETAAFENHHNLFTAACDVIFRW
jgi:Putative beta-barrel porin-2, OmpL-like. bbp2